MIQEGLHSLVPIYNDLISLSPSPILAETKDYTPYRPKIAYSDVGRVNFFASAISMGRNNVRCLIVSVQTCWNDFEVLYINLSACFKDNSWRWCVTFRASQETGYIGRLPYCHHCLLWNEQISNWPSTMYSRYTSGKNVTPSQQF